MLGSPSVSMLITPVPAAAATSTVAEPPMVAEEVGTNATPGAGVMPAGSPTARHWAGVDVPNEVMMTGVLAVVAVRGVPEIGLTLELNPLRDLL